MGQNGSHSHPFTGKFDFFTHSNKETYFVHVLSHDSLRPTPIHIMSQRVYRRVSAKTSYVTFWAKKSSLHRSHFCHHRVTDPTSATTVSQIPPLPPPCHRSHFCHHHVTDPTSATHVTDTTSATNVSRIPPLPPMCHRSNFFHQCFTDPTSAPTMYRSHLSHHVIDPTSATTASQIPLLALAKNVSQIPLLPPMCHRSHYWHW